ncbi:MAG: MFS transporter [Bacteroidia bacterium]|nr:MFS transporter [Bacteroidia bacterium]
MTGKERTLLFVLACINFASILDFMIMMPLQEYLAPVFHVSPFEFNLLVASYSVSAFVSSFSATFFADRFDRKKLLLFAFIGFLTGTLGCGFAPTYGWMMTSRIVAGLFGGMISAQVQSIVGDLFPYGKRGRAMGTLMGAFALAAVVGVPAGLWIAKDFGWQMPFIFIAAFGFLLIPFILALVPNVTSHIAERGKTGAIYGALFSDRNMQWGLLMAFMLVLGHFLTIPFIAPFLEVNVGVSKEEVALMYMVGGFSSLVAAPLIGKLADKFGKHKIFGVTMFLSFIPVILMTHLKVVPLWHVLVIASMFFFFAGGRMIPAQALISSLVKPNLRGSFMNLNSSLMQLATGLAAVIGGLIVDKTTAGTYIHFEYTGYLSVLFGLLSFLLVMRVKAVDV